MPFIVRAVEKLYAGNVDVSPDSIEFKISLSLIAIIDDIVRRLPFIKLKNILGVNSVRDLVEPLLYNNGLDDEKLIIDLNTPPKERESLPKFHSRKGGIVITAVVISLLVLIPLIVPFALIYTPIGCVSYAVEKRKVERAACGLEKGKISRS